MARATKTTKKNRPITMDVVEEMIQQDEQQEDIFTTSLGVRIPVRPISPTLFNRVMHSVKTPDPPTYEVEIAGGGTQTFAHDEDSIKGDPEAEKVWREYIEATNQAEAERNLRVLRLVILKGTALEMPKDDEWSELQTYLGLAVPEDPVERYIHYLETEALGDQDDISGLMAAVGRAMGVSQEEIDQSVESFRNNLGNRGRSQTPGDATQDGAESMEHKLTL